MYNSQMNYINQLNLELLNTVFWNNTILEYLIALGVFVLSLIVLKIFKIVIISRLKRLAEKTNTNIDDILIKTIDSIKWSFYFLISIFIAIQFITLMRVIDQAISFIIIVILTYYIVKIIQEFIEYGFDNIIKKKEKEEDFDSSILNLSKKIIKVVLWAVAIIILLQNFGYNVSTLVGGLGLGGLAIAFALQNILGDIFASFSIYLDKPFRIGDYIVIGSDSGIVKKIGIKSTRITTLQGEELVISNKELTGVRVRNFKQMERRRIFFTIGVIYNTPTTKMKKIPALIKKIFRKIDNADLDRVHFKKFNDSSLDFEIVYFLNSREYSDYMDTQQNINLAIKESFEKEKIEFAYPTQTIFLEK